MIVTLMACCLIHGASFTVLDMFGTGDTRAVAWCDYDRDGDLDLAVMNSWNGVNMLYRNDGGGQFTELRRFTPFPSPLSTGCCWGDFDNDGQPDLAVCFEGSLPCMLYRNVGNDSFVGSQQFGSGRRWGIVAGDCNNDGRLDAVVADLFVGNQLYTNEVDTFVGRGVFSSIGAAGVALGDYQDDGHLDLALANYDWQGKDEVYRGSPTGTFTKVRNLLGAHYGCAFVDYDNDGDLDLSVFGNNDTVCLYEHVMGDSFVAHVPFPRAYALCYGGSWGDFDNDGQVDVALASDASGVIVLRNEGVGRFSEAYLLQMTHTYCIAWGDYDDDGDLDLAVGNFENQQNRLLRNETNNSDFVKIQPEGRGQMGYSNVMGIGTRFTLRTADWSIAGNSEISGGFGCYGSSMNAPESHFGVPAGDTFTVLVTWPASGIVDTIEKVIPPARLKVVENRRPGLFSLASPAKGTETSRKPTLAWHKATDPDGDVVTYDLWYGKNPTFATHTEVKGLADTIWTPSALLDSATYYWKVLAIDREHRVISYRNHYTDTMAVDSLGAETWCTEQDWYFNATAAGVSEESGVRSEEIAAPSLTVLRNPVRGALTVRWALPAGESGKLDILDVTGRVVESHVLSAHGSRLTPNVPPGVYFVHLSSAGRSVTAKVVKVE